MMLRFGLPLVIAASLFGCTTTQQLRQRPSGAELQALSDASRTGPVTLLYQHPPGSTSPAPRPPQPVGTLPSADANVPLGDLSRIRGYETKRRGRGALDGLGLGMLGGFLAGALVAATQTGEEGTPCVDHCGPHISDGTVMVVGGMVGAAVGGAIGLGTGAIIGHKDRYLF
jgi:hypothetical protein